MPGNGRVFISHAHSDNARCQPVLKALDEWHVSYWFDTQTMAAGDDLTDSIQQAITESDIFLRVCTPAIQQSYWCKLEQSAFRGLVAADHKRGGDGQRVLINLILDRDYQREPFDYDTVFINGTHAPVDVWLPDLYQALDRNNAIPTPPVEPHVSPPDPILAPQLPASSPPHPPSAPRPSPAAPADPAASGVARGRRALQRILLAALLLLVLTFAGLAYTHGSLALFQTRATATATIFLATPPNATPVPLTTYDSTKLRYRVTLPATFNHTFLASANVNGDYSWTETISGLPYGTYPAPWAKAPLAALTIMESSDYANLTGTAIVNDLIPRYIHNGKVPPVSALHKTNAECAQASLSTVDSTAPFEIVIGCAYAGRGYSILLSDALFELAADQQGFFDPFLASLTFY